MGSLHVAGGGATTALEASGRLERARLAALDRALVERRRRHAAQIALSLAELLCDEEASPVELGRWA